MVLLAENLGQLQVGITAEVATNRGRRREGGKQRKEGLEGMDGMKEWRGRKGRSGWKEGSDSISYLSMFKKPITLYFTELELNQMNMPLSL